MGPLRPRFRLPMNAVTPMKPHLAASDARGFGHVDTWIFDLDNTLYPHDARVWPQVDDRITAYIAELYGLDGISARALQKYFYHRHAQARRERSHEARHLRPFRGRVRHRRRRLRAEARPPRLRALPRQARR